MKKRTVALTMAASMMASSLGIGGVTAYAAEDPIVIGAVWAMKRKNFDFRHKSFFVAQDIDIRCVWMAYIQLSLYGIPAVVIHGDTLAMKEWSRWYTPLASVPFGKRKCTAYSAEEGVAKIG